MREILWVAVVILGVCIIILAILLIKGWRDMRKSEQALMSAIIESRNIARALVRNAERGYTGNMNTKLNGSYPNTLSRAITEIVETEHYSVNDVLESFQFLYSEVKLNQMITWTMRNNVVNMLKENGAKVWK